MPARSLSRWHGGRGFFGRLACRSPCLRESSRFVADPRVRVVVDAWLPARAVFVAQLTEASVDLHVVPAAEPHDVLRPVIAGVAVDVVSVHRVLGALEDL